MRVLYYAGKIFKLAKSNFLFLFNNRKKVKLFEVVKVKDIIVVPYEELLDAPIGGEEHKGGPIWNYWDEFNTFRHKRGAYIDVCPTVPSIDTQTESSNLFWCGALTNHFGHQVADFTSRIPAYKIFQKQVGLKAKYCFSIKNGEHICDINSAPSFFREILQWFNIDFDDVQIVNRPVLVESLYATPQLEYLTPFGTNLDYRYIEFLNEHTYEKLGQVLRNKNTYYISRRYMSGGMLAGDSYIEEFLENSGIIIIYPERLTLVEQINLYRNASNLIFLEGSAIHTLQFLGKCDVNIHVINRRPGTKMLVDSLKSRFATVEYYNFVQLIYGLTEGGEDARYDGISIINKERFFMFLSSLDINVKNWNPSLFEKAEYNGLKNWLNHRVSLEQHNIDKSVEKITSRFKEVNLNISDYL